MTQYKGYYIDHIYFHSKAEIDAIAKVCEKAGIYVISDEIYEKILFDGVHLSLASLPDLRDRVITVNGFSKCAAMTGWRLGYVCGRREIVAAMTKLHQYGIMSAPTTSQYAAIEAMRNGDKDIQKMRDEYDGRRRFLVSGFRKLGLECFEPKGAFYTFPCIKSTGLGSEEFCERLLKEKHVAVVPGNAFGESGEGFIRISYCYSIKHITEALKRMREFLEERGLCK